MMLSARSKPAPTPCRKISSVKNRRLIRTKKRTRMVKGLIEGIVSPEGCQSRRGLESGAVRADGQQQQDEGKSSITEPVHALPGSLLCDTCPFAEAPCAT